MATVTRPEDSIRREMQSLSTQFQEAQFEPHQETQQALISSIRDSYFQILSELGPQTPDDIQGLSHSLGTCLGIGFQYEPAPVLPQEVEAPRIGLLERVQNAWLRIPTLGRHAIGVAGTATALVMSGPMSALATGVLYTFAHKELTAPAPEDVPYL